MSNKALTWAFESGLATGPRFVLVVLADHAGDHSGEDWSCYPSIARIAEFAGMGRSTVERHISWLWREGWISRVPRWRPDGSLGINDYTLHRAPEKREALKASRARVDELSALCDAFAAGDDEAEPPPSIRGVPPPLDLRGGPPRIGATPPLDLRAHEPSADKPSSEPSSAREPGDDGFDELCTLWPLGGRKFTRWPEARAAYAKSRESESFERLKAALIDCSKDPRRLKGDHGFPGLQKFFADEIWRGYLKGSEPVSVRTRFAGPDDLRDDAIRARDETWVNLNLDRAAWNAEARTITAHKDSAFLAMRACMGGVLARHNATLCPPETQP